MKRLSSMTAAALTLATLTATGGALLSTTAASAVPRDAAIEADASALADGRMEKSACVSVWPVTEFYEAGRKASFPLTVPASSCTTISVSDIQDTANPSDRCQTFLVGFFPPDGSEATYTEPVTACSLPSKTRTVLAWQVPDGMVYRILYDIDYLEPTSQVVRYKAWH
jgi:hypothetical protein